MNQEGIEIHIHQIDINIGKQNIFYWWNVGKNYNLGTDLDHVDVCHLMFPWSTINQSFNHNSGMAMDP